jgi:hypothetical protein
MEIIDCHSNSVVEKQRGLSYNTLGLAFNSTQNRVYVCQKGDGAAPGDVVVLGAP